MNERMEEAALFLHEKGETGLRALHTVADEKANFDPFSFLKPNDALHPYFCYLLQRLKLKKGLLFQQKRDFQKGEGW